MKTTTAKIWSLIGKQKYVGWAWWPERLQRGGAGARLLFGPLLLAPALFHILGVYGIFKQEFVAEATALCSDQDAQSPWQQVWSCHMASLRETGAEESGFPLSVTLAPETILLPSHPPLSFFLPLSLSLLPFFIPSFPCSFNLLFNSIIYWAGTVSGIVIGEVLEKQQQTQQRKNFHVNESFIVGLFSEIKLLKIAFPIRDSIFWPIVNFDLCFPQVFVLHVASELTFWFINQTLMV